MFGGFLLLVSVFSQPIGCGLSCCKIEPEENHVLCMHFNSLIKIHRSLHKLHNTATKRHTHANNMKDLLGKCANGIMRHMSIKIWDQMSINNVLLGCACTIKKANQATKEFTTLVIIHCFGKPLLISL